jgi:putative ABC transport system permease protein
MAMTTAFVRELRGVDAGVVASQVKPLAAHISESLAPRRFSVTLMAAFALAALVLALAGIYAVVLYSISQRAREIAIRMALGARSGTIVQLVVRQEAVYVVFGLAIGIGTAAAATRLLTTMLVGVTADDAATFFQVFAVVALFSLIASALPACRMVGQESLR